MTPETVMTMGRTAMEVCLMVAAPLLLVALIIGLIVSIFQAATQINETTLSFIPKLVGIFVALVVAGPDGLTPGAIADKLEVAPSALSFHLKELAHSGLVSSEPRGRNLIYRADFGQMNALLSYLTEHCCQGEACAVTAGAACTNG